MEELSLDNILDEGKIKDFLTDEDVLDDEDEGEENQSSEGEEEQSEQEQNNETAEVNLEDIVEAKPESVGSGQEDQEDTGFDEGTSSPKNFYSSIASALVEDGIFQNLDKEALGKIKSAEDFAEVVDRQVESRLDEKQRRISDALTAGVEPTEVQKYENLIRFLNNVSDDALNAETEKGETLRKSLIYQDYVNKGFTPDRAKKEVERSIKAGTDIEDAAEALQSNKDYYQQGYANLINNARNAEAQRRNALKKQVEELKNSIYNDDKAFGDVVVDKVTRKKVYENIMKPAYKDPQTGDLMTAVQKYSNEHRVEFLKNVGLLYTLTDGFKNVDKLVQGKIKKEMKKGLRELEKTINHTARTNGGALNFASGVGDPDSKFTNWDLDI